MSSATLVFAEVSPHLMAFSVFKQYIMYEMFGARMCIADAYVSAGKKEMVLLFS